MRLIRLGSLKFRQTLLGALAGSALLAPLALTGTAANAQQAAAKATPASNADIAVYQAMGTSFFCMAALNGVEFPKALGISTTTHAQILKGRHNGQVASLKGQTLTDKQMLAGAEEQVLLRAMSACPKAIPTDVQNKIKAALKKRGS